MKASPRRINIRDGIGLEEGKIMPEKSVTQKLFVKAGHAVLSINAPKNVMGIDDP
jgi:hypothetical protein